MGKKRDCRKFLRNISVSSDRFSDDSFTAHINECSECRRDLEIVKMIYTPSGNREVEPSSIVESRIIQSYGEIALESKPGAKKFFRPFLISAAAVCVILFMSFIYEQMKISRPDKNVSVTFKNIRGNVLVDNIMARGPMKLNESSVITTGEDSIAEVAFDGLFYIKITCNTTLKIEKALFDARKNIFNFAFSLIDGVVLSRDLDKSKYDLAFLTPNMEFKSADTEFLLSVNRDKTMLFMSSGHLDFSPKGSGGQDVNAATDSKYTISNTVVTQKMDDSDRRMIEFVHENTDISHVSLHPSMKDNNRNLMAENNPCDKILSGINRENKSKN